MTYNIIIIYGYEVDDDDHEDDDCEDDNGDNDGDDDDGNNNVTMFERVMGCKYSLLSTILSLFRLLS